MKKLFYLLMVAMWATMFTACSKDNDDDDDAIDPNKEGVITMSGDFDSGYHDLSVFTFNLGDVITIDWGDGTVEEYVSEEVEFDWEEELNLLLPYSYEVDHNYAKRQSYTITIKGKIKGLYSHSNNTTFINVSKCPALTALILFGEEELTSLDVSKNTALTWLECDSNQLTSLDVSKNTALTHLVCYCNQLTSLDVSKNKALIYLQVDGNLTSLDVSKNTALTALWCSYNKLTSLDVSKNTALTVLHCVNNQLTSLDISKNTALTELRCDGNQLTSLDISKNTALTTLWCSNNELSASALNQVFNDLPVSGQNLRISGNPGTENCNTSIAKNKGWIAWDVSDY